MKIISPKMILTKDKEGELCLIRNQGLDWYDDHKIICVVKLPIELRRCKGSEKLEDILLKQKNKLEYAQEEVRLRKKLIGIIEELKQLGLIKNNSPELS